MALLSLKSELLYFRPPKSIQPFAKFVSPPRFVLLKPRCRSSAVRCHASNNLFGGLGKLFQKDSASSEPRPQPSNQSEVPEVPSIFPPYTVVKRCDGYDLRLYEAYSIIEMSYEGRAEAYAALGDYFDGANTDNVLFKYTQPIVMRYEPQGAKFMQMYVGAPRYPPDLVLKELPEPINKLVRHSVAGGELLAVMKFEGYITPDTAKAALERLKTYLKEDGLQLHPDEAAGLFRVAQYGPVYSLSPRLNEMMLRIQV